MLEKNKIYCMDCLDGLKQLTDQSVDLVVTSPPYNIGGNNMISYERNKRITKSKYSNIDDKMPEQDYFVFLDKVIKELLRVSRYTFFNITPLSNNKSSVFRLIGKYHNKIKEIIIWNKEYGVPAIEDGVLNSAYELIIVFSDKEGDKRKFYYHNLIKGKTNNIFRFKKRLKEETQKEHGAIFPIELPREFIKLFTKEGDLVLDPFMGFGTTAFASKQLGRDFIGFEINQDYVDKANKRLSQQTLNTTKKEVGIPPITKVKGILPTFL